MEILKKELFFSKQGRASTHTNTLLFHGKKRKPKIKEFNLIYPVDAEKLLLSIQTQRKQEEAKFKSKKKQLTSAFKTISRAQYENAYRNRTESPDVGSYTPRFTAIDGRLSQAPKFINSTHTPRERKISLPCCIDEAMKCTFFNANKNKSTTSAIKNVITMEEYQQKLSRIVVKTPNISDRILSPIDFEKQLSRSPFVKYGSPPHEKRFSSHLLNTHVHSNNKRPPQINFTKMLSRSDLIKPRTTVGPYDAKEELTRPRIGTKIMQFNKMLSRKPLIIKHLLESPVSPDVETFDKSFNKQSTIRG